MADKGEPSAKKARVDGAIIRPSLLAPESRAALKAAYGGAQPYPHVVIKELCDPERLRAVREEIITNVHATYKETDLFKMFQTGDLANMDSLEPEQAAKLPTVRALRDALYSQEFRDFVSEIVGCGELSDKTDCACNVHAKGGHLLCHDDVIGDRRVSYIIYLTDPDDPWGPEDGGHLELYPGLEGTPNQPDVIPTTTYVPSWNCMGMFAVQPGRSFHSIQEVLAAGKPRMSIQGWFHGRSPPEGADTLATLRQLQARGAPSGGGFAELAGGDPAAELSQEDRTFLGKFLNDTYLQPGAWAAVAQRVEADGSVQLQGFLKPQLAARIMEATRAEDAAAGLGGGRLPAYDAGIGGGWEAVGPAHKQRYLRYQGPADEAAGAAGALLATLRDQLFGSAAFARLLRKLTTLGLLGVASEVRRFRPGLDYTVAHHGLLCPELRLDAVLCFVDDGSADPTPAGTAAAAAGGAAGKAAAQGEGKPARGAAARAKAAKAAQAETAAGEGAKEGEGPPPSKAELWDSGDVGGFEAYVLADEEENEASEVYKGGDDESGVLNVSAAPNSLNLVLRDEGLMRFVKYVSAAAPGSRWDVSAVYRPEPDSDDEHEAPEAGA